MAGEGGTGTHLLSAEITLCLIGGGGAADVLRGETFVYFAWKI